MFVTFRRFRVYLGAVDARVGSSTIEAQPEHPGTIVSTGSAVAGRDCPNPIGTVISGNQKSRWAISPAT